MKNILKLTVAGCVFSLATLGTAQAALTSDMYVRGDAGISIPTDLGGTYKSGGLKSLDNSAYFGLGAGYRLNENFRTDLNIGYMNEFKLSKSFKGSNGGDTFKQKINSMSVILNAYYDICDYNNFIPYVTAGIGGARNKTKKATEVFTNADGSAVTQTLTQAGKSKTNFAWNVGLGVMYKFQDNFYVDLGYKYNDLGDLETKKMAVSQTAAGVQGNTTSAFKSKLKVHNITLGVIYAF